MKTKDVLIFIVAIVAIALAAFGVSKLFGSDGPNKKEPTGFDINGNPIYDEDEVYIPKYLSTEEALEIANDLYHKAELIMYDPLSYNEFNFQDSDLEGYKTVITNYYAVASVIFLDIKKPIKKEFLTTDNGEVYLNNDLKPKDPSYLKTTLQIKENNEDKIIFSAVSTYCLVNNKQCDENQLLSNSTEKTYDFSIVKNNNIWKVSDFTLPY